MKFPAGYLHNNLVWSLDDGSCWGFWKVTQTTYAMLSDEEKLGVHSRVKRLLIGLPENSMFLSTHRQIPSDELAARMTDGIDMVKHPHWQIAVDSARAELELTRGFERLLYIGVALDDGTGHTGGWREAFEAAKASMAAMVGLTPSAPSDGEIAKRTAAARLVAARAATSLELTPVSPAEIRWLYMRSVCRGLHQPRLDAAWDVEHGGSVAGTSVQTIMDARFFEGGQKHTKGRPRHRRFLTIDSEAGTSHQALMAVSDMPHSWVYPGGGGEWFLRADSVAFPVDWCVRISAVSNDEAAGATRKKARGLEAQVVEYEGDPAGTPPSLAEAADALDAQRQELSNSPASPELRTTVVLAVGAPDIEMLEAQVAQVESVFESFEYQIARPVGGQLELWASMQPASRKRRVCSDYLQYLMPRDLAAGAPTAGTDIGDPRGMFLGSTLAAATLQPVLHDPAYGPTINRSASSGFFGTLGSGKSYAAKRIAWATIARGGKVIAVDRTTDAEYVRFAEVVPGEAHVIKLGKDTPYSFDPMRLFPPEVREEVTVAFLTLLCQLTATDLAVATLAEGVKRAIAEGFTIVDVEKEIRMLDPDLFAGIDELSQRLKQIARADYAQMVFDPNREPADWDADYIVLHTPGMDIPDRETVMNEHLASKMLPQEVFAQAVLYLVAALAKTAIFQDKSRFAAALLDEVWWLTSSPQGKKLLDTGIRDGRKHNAAVWLLSQSTEDLGDDRLAQFLGNRFVFKQGTGGGAAALKFLGLDASREMVDLVEQRFQTGMCLYKDVAGRVAAVMVNKAEADLDRAFDTNPEANRVAQVVASTEDDPHRRPHNPLAHQPSGRSDNPAVGPGHCDLVRRCWDGCWWRRSPCPQCLASRLPHWLKTSRSRNRCKFRTRRRASSIQTQPSHQTQTSTSSSSPSQMTSSSNTAAPGSLSGKRTARWSMTSRTKPTSG